MKISPAVALLPLMLAAVPCFGDSAYIFDSFSSPVVDPATVPFTYTGTGGYELLLNGSKVATSAVAAAKSVKINQALTYSDSNDIDSGESTSGYGSFAAYVNSEVGKMDDSGFVAEGTPDTKLNIDFSDNGWVVLKTNATGIDFLLLAEDSGIDPFKLAFKPFSGPGSSTWTTLFDGWNSGVQSTLTSHGFGTDDVAPGIDQQFLFTFDSTKAGYFKIWQTSEPLSDSSYIELDFAGGGSYAAVPEPGMFGLLAAGLGIGAWVRRRRSVNQ